MGVETLTFSNGPLRFSAQAMGQGPVVLCLHGFPDNASSFRHQLPALAEAGYRAIALTLRGYEPSSIPEDGDYSMGALAADVVAVIDQLEQSEVHLVGHDWGAAIAYGIGATYPDRLRSVTTMAVPHAGRFSRQGMRYLKQLRLSWYMGFFQLKGLSDYWVRRDKFAFIRRLWRDWSPGWTPEEGVLENVIESLSAPGVLPAALGYYRAGLTMSALTQPIEEAFFKVLVPTLALSGERDGCIDSTIFEGLMRDEDFPEGLRFQRIASAGHFPHQEQPGVINGLIIEWIRQNSV